MDYMCFCGRTSLALSPPLSSLSLSHSLVPLSLSIHTDTKKHTFSLRDSIIYQSARSLSPIRSSWSTSCPLTTVARPRLCSFLDFLHSHLPTLSLLPLPLRSRYSPYDMPITPLQESGGRGDGVFMRICVNRCGDDASGVLMGVRMLMNGAVVRGV
ncbi:MAG: hypothetical protein J3Q66DRAFT_338464 [Benniella sp.]|nr:MAG: hypothetical protein J3Q66DRAFT_338464 [Benniella sp.]